MIDNSWVKNSHQNNGRSDGIKKTKVYLTIAVILIGAILTAGMNGVGSNATQYQSQGIVIDFGNYQTVWTSADYSHTNDPMELLETACQSHNYTHTVNEGKITEINGVSDSSEKTWGLWYVEKSQGSTVNTSFTKSATYSIKASDYTVVAWAYCSESEKPTVAVDASGTSIYGYAQSTRMVTLSPVSTEIVGAMNAVSLIKGTDMYSNYPDSVAAGKSSGTIAEVGTYTDPSYESIMHQNPDLVICDGSQYKHIQMAKTLRNSNVNSVLLYNGEDVQTIIDNIFIVGTAMHYELRAQEVVKELNDAMKTMESLVSGQPEKKVMISLSSSTSPYIAGDGTYASDILGLMGGINIYKDKAGWAHINSEIIGHSDRYGDQYNPDIIIIISNDSQYSATQSSYDSMIGGLSKNWKNTTAYANGDIYLICEKAGEMAQRSGPRFAQFAELTARIACPSAFDDGISIPKFIGDDYAKYLKYTSDLGFGD